VLAAAAHAVGDDGAHPFERYEAGGENQVRGTRAWPAIPHPCRGPARQARSRQQGAPLGYFRHGCFWHSHKSCQLASKPRSNTGYWSDKLARNQARDAAHVQALRELGFHVLTVWECDTRNEARLREVLAGFFGQPSGERAVSGVAPREEDQRA
jgi:hypothetical protein